MQKTSASAIAEAQALLGSRPDQAAGRARAILRTVPNDTRAKLLLGAALRRTGDAVGARDVLAPLAEAHPAAWGVQFEIGGALAMLGETAGAVAALGRAGALNPRSSLAWHALGDQLAIQGDEAGAADAHGRVLEGSIHDPALVQAAGELLDGAGQTAATVLQDRFNMHLCDPLSARLVADVGLRLGRHEAVEALATPHLDRAPGFAPLRHSLALALQGQGAMLRSADHVRRLRSEHPAAPAYRLLEAALLVELADYGRALAAYEGALNDRPGDARIWLAYGHVLKIVGRQGDCIAAYRRSLALAPNSGEAYWSLANLKLAAFSQDDLAAMAARLAVRPSDGAAQEPEATDRAAMLYAYAKALEDAGRFEEAFSHYRRGAALRRAAAPWDGAAHSDYVRRTIATFTPAFLAACQGVGSRAADPIFVVGLPRSGSTLVEQILASHPQVEGLSERPDLMALARRLACVGQARGLAYPEALGDVDGEALGALGEAYLAGLRPNRRLGRAFFVDKFPGNFLHTGLIQLILPRARIIDVRRQPMACCVSVFRQYFAQGQSYSYDLEDLGRYYADYVELMAHFDAMLPGRVLHLHYEDLVADPEGRTRQLLDYCGLPFDPACLKFYESRRPVRTASSEQVRRPISAIGLDHWRNFAPWLAPLEAALGPARHSYRADALPAEAI